MIDYKPQNRVFTRSGTIPGSRMSTLFSNPFEILTQNNNVYNSVIPLNFIIRINNSAFTPGVINNFLLGFQIPITNQLPAVNGAFCSLNNPLPDISPGAGFYTLGIRQSTQHINYIVGNVPIVLMTDADDLGSTFGDCLFWFTYSTINI